MTMENLRRDTIPTIEHDPMTDFDTLSPEMRKVLRGLPFRATANSARGSTPESIKVWASWVTAELVLTTYGKDHPHFHDWDAERFLFHEMMTRANGNSPKQSRKKVSASAQH
jgi:hypothetical protein